MIYYSIWNNLTVFYYNIEVLYIRLLKLTKTYILKKNMTCSRKAYFKNLLGKYVSLKFLAVGFP